MFLLVFEWGDPDRHQQPWAFRSDGSDGSDPPGRDERRQFTSGGHMV